MSQELDISPIASDRRIDEVIQSVNDLKEDERLIIRCDENFFDTIGDLYAKLEEQFVWSPLLSGPDQWKGEILKTPAGAGIHKSIIEFMTFDHKRCDELYAEGESAGNEGDWELAVQYIKAFELGMRRHLGAEENILFPAFTEATGMIGGPVQVMIMEHEQMRGVLAQMISAIDDNDRETLFSLGDTLVILMQQHNVKEEGILYPMIEQHLSDRAEEIIQRIQLYEAS